MKNPLLAVLLASLLLACPKNARDSAADANAVGQTPDALGSEDAGAVLPSETEDAGSPAAASEEACVDAWLKERTLDRYGHPEGTMYAGGNPLFDERTGEKRERLPYVYARQPAAREACGSRAQ